MERREWIINWLAPLTPDLAFIPESSIFSITSQHYSLTATGTNTPGLLFASPDVLVELANQLAVKEATLQRVPRCLLKRDHKRVLGRNNNILLYSDCKRLLYHEDKKGSDSHHLRLLPY